MTQTFFPKVAGKTKQNVFDSIKERRYCGFPACYSKLVSPVDETLLTDERMQEYVNNDYDAMFDNIEYGDEAVGRETERVLFELAKGLSRDTETEFELGDDGDSDEE